MIDRHQFTEQLGAVVEQLDRKSIDYRAIGSVAGEALGIIPIDFSPRSAIDPIDQRPDLDVIVSRSDLPGAREIRESFAHSSYPLKLGLAIPSMQVDLQPDNEFSKLTWGKYDIPVTTRVFDAQVGALDDVTVKTVPPETLRHFYSSMSSVGAGGEKYRQKLARFNDVLGHDNGHTTDNPYTAFHEYADLMRRYQPISRRSMEMFYALTAKMTPEQRNRMRHIAFKLANVAGWR